MKLRALPCLIVCIFTITLQAQEIDLEGLLEAELESDDQVELMEQLQDLLESPLDLNQVSVEELRLLPWITPGMARDIVNHRRRHGRFRSIDELLDLPSIDEESFDILRHFVAVDWVKGFSLHTRQRIQRQETLPVGFSEGIYPGSPEKFYSRIKLNWGNKLSLRMVNEKDPGEKSLADHYSGALVWQERQIPTKFVLGNFSYERGHGLMSWGRFRFTGSGSDPIQPFLQQSRGLVPNATSSELGTPTGLGFSSRFGQTNLTGFCATIHHDATIQGDSVSAIVTSGYHRTPQENAKANNLMERLVGLDCSFQNRAGEFGIGLLGNRFNRPFVSDHHNKRQNLIFSLYYSKAIKNLNISAESAVDQSGAVSSYGQGLLALPSLDMVVSAWRYNPEFNNRHAFTVGQNRQAQNEHGVTLGTKARIKKALLISLFSTFYKTPQSTLSMPFPGSGSRHTFVATFRPQSQLRLIAKITMRNKYALEDSKDQFENVVKKIALGRTIALRLQLDYQLTKALSIKSRYETNKFISTTFGYFSADRADTTGTLIYHQFSLRRNNFGILGRWCLFDAPGYEVRFYVYENDAPGVMRLSALQHRGSRSFLLLWCRFKISTVYFKIERTRYDNRESAGSGHDLIPSPENSAFAVQLELRL